MQCSTLYAGVQRRLYTGMSTADVPMCADVVFVVTRQSMSTIETEVSASITSLTTATGAGYDHRSVKIT